MKKYRVVQWATGVVGSAALRGILRHPKLELVGVKVYNEDKEGRDAGEIVGMEATGVLATRDVEAIIALDADCVIYAPMPWDLAEMCRIL
jgi:4-hydroxy-tetrahydrodipicolinate reductase